MITIEYIAKKLAEKFPEHNFVPNSRVAYQAIQIDGKSELRLTNEALDLHTPDDFMWINSLASSIEGTVGFIASKVPVHYVEQMSKDKAEPDAVQQAVQADVVIEKMKQ